MADGTTDESVAADQHDLQRFVDAQRDSYHRALSELRSGEKRSHWMWYVFPQLAGLGTSQMAQRYAIRGRDEAVAYLEHPVLSPRLRECAGALLQLPETSATDIMGSPDDLKLRSSATLFAAVSEADSIFEQLLHRFFGGEPDARTQELLLSKQGEF